MTVWFAPGVWQALQYAFFPPGLLATAVLLFGGIIARRQVLRRARRGFGDTQSNFDGSSRAYDGWCAAACWRAAVSSFKLESDRWTWIRNTYVTRAVISWLSVHINTHMYLLNR